MAIIKVIILAVVLLSLALAGLAITMLIKKNGKFPNTHIGGNRYLKKKGIYCAQTEDKIEQAKAKKEVQFKDMKFVGKQD